MRAWREVLKRPGRSPSQIRGPSNGPELSTNWKLNSPLSRRGHKPWLRRPGQSCVIHPPAARSWSVAECLQHLNISADAYFPIWQQIIADAGPRKTEMNAPYRSDFWGRPLSWILEPPPRVRSKTPIPFEPMACGTVESVLSGFLERQQRMVATLHRCRGRAIDQVRMASPVDPRIRYSIWSSFLIVSAHQRRHLWQAEQAVQKLRSGK
jgi:hypothetical protein